MIPPPDDERIVEEIYDALDDGEPHEALARARSALSTLGEDPVLRFLAGTALLELDRPGEAADELRLAVALDEDDPEFRSALAFALFKACRFPEAEIEARAAIASDADLPDALHVAALLDERAGRFRDADERFARAAAADSERYPAPVRVAREAFLEEVEAARDLLPPEFRAHLDAVAVTVESVPSDSILMEESPPLDPELLGLFVGSALDETSFDGPIVRHPARILLFQRNIERHAENEAHLREEIARTLHHELAHYLGFEEDDMPGMDLD